MDEDPTPGHVGARDLGGVCWPLVAVTVTGWAERLAVSTVIATVDPARGLAAAWAGVTVLAHTARTVATLDPVDAIGWERARPRMSAVIRALSGAPSLPAAGRLVPDEVWWIPAGPATALGRSPAPRPHLVSGARSRSTARIGDMIPINNARNGLRGLCQNLTRVLSVTSRHAPSPADQAAAATAAEHATWLATEFRPLTVSLWPLPATSGISRARGPVESAPPAA